MDLNKTALREIAPHPVFDVQLKVIYIYRFLELFLRFVDFLKGVLNFCFKQGYTGYFHCLVFIQTKSTQFSSKVKLDIIFQFTEQILTSEQLLQKTTT